MLEHRLRDALDRLNPSLPVEASDDAFRKITRPEGSTLEARNRAFHRLLVDGVTVEYRTAGGDARGTSLRPRLPKPRVQRLARGSIALSDWGEIGSVSSRKSVFKAGDILFGKLRPYFHKAGIAPVDGFCSTDIVVLSSRKPRRSSFVLACVSSSAFVAHTSQTATGTKMPRTSWRTMGEYEFVRPTDAVASEFQRIVSPMLGRIVGNIHESRALAALRDILLPKLISGEVRAVEAETFVGTRT